MLFNYVTRDKWEEVKLLMVPSLFVHSISNLFVCFFKVIIAEHHICLIVDAIALEFFLFCLFFYKSFNVFFLFILFC